MWAEMRRVDRMGSYQPGRPSHKGRSDGPLEGFPDRGDGEPGGAALR
jgi:hypothetical protein